MVALGIAMSSVMNGKDLKWSAVLLPRRVQIPGVGDPVTGSGDVMVTIGYFLPDFYARNALPGFA